MTDTLIRKKPWYQRLGLFNAKVAVTNQELFERNKYIEDFYGIKRPKKRSAGYVEEFRYKPKSLGKIYTLEQFLFVLGEWVLEIKKIIENPNFFETVGKVQGELEDLLLVIENNAEFLHATLDKIILWAYGKPEEWPNPPITDDVATKHAWRGIENLAWIFKRGNSYPFIIEWFLTYCPKAVAGLSHRSRELLAEKYKPAEVLSELKSLTAWRKNPQEAINFLIKNRNWINGDHLFDGEALVYLSQKISESQLKKYLTGNKDVEGQRPVDKLKASFLKAIQPAQQTNQVTHVENKQSDESKQTIEPKINHILLKTLQNDIVFGLLNLSNKQMVQWMERSNCDPQVCALLARKDDFYKNTGKEKLKELAEKSAYIKAGLELKQFIEKSKKQKPWWRFESTQMRMSLKTILDKALRDLQSKQLIPFQQFEEQQAQFALLASDEKLWKRISEQYNKGKLAMLSPFFAAKFNHPRLKQQALDKMKERLEQYTVAECEQLAKGVFALDPDARCLAEKRLEKQNPLIHAVVLRDKHTVDLHDDLSTAMSKLLDQTRHFTPLDSSDTEIGKQRIAAEQKAEEAQKRLAQKLEELAMAEQRNIKAREEVARLEKELAVVRAAEAHKKMISEQNTGATEQPLMSSEQYKPVFVKTMADGIKIEPPTEKQIHEVHHLKPELPVIGV